MNEANQRALVVGYFLSRVPNAYQLLGFDTHLKCHEAVGAVLGLTADAIKNRRDEFDPLHNNPRVGWYQRELRPSRRLVVELFQEVGEAALLALVREWLEPGEGANHIQVSKLIPEVEDSSEGEDIAQSARSITGVRAEQIFMQSFDQGSLPLSGVLVDCRHDGGGYDFCLQVPGRPPLLVEVKGLAGDAGQVTFTAKEWTVAKESGDLYVLALVRNVYDNAIVTLHQNPAAHLRATSRLITVVQETWSVRSGQLSTVGPPR